MLNFCILISLLFITATPSFAKAPKEIQLKDLRVEDSEKQIRGRTPQSVDQKIEEERRNQERYQKLREFSDRMMDLREPNPRMEY